MRKQSTPPADQSKKACTEHTEGVMPELTDEEVAFEMVELACDEMDSLSRAFNMITDLCAELTEEVEEEIAEDLGNLKIH